MADDDYRSAARKRAAQRKTSSWYKLVGTPDGTDNTFRILRTPGTKPPKDTTDKQAVRDYKRNKTGPVWFEYSIHRDIGPKKQTVRCGKDPMNNDEGECWLCDTKIPSLRRAGQNARADALAPQNVLTLQVAKVVINDDGAVKYEGPLIFQPSKKVGDQILSSVIGSKRRDYVDSKKGYNLTINRIGTGMNDTKYGMLEPDEDPSEVPEELVKKLKPFSELKEIHKYDQNAQKSAYLGEDAPASNDDDDEDTPKPKLVSKPKSKKPAPPADEDEGDDDTADDDDVDDTETADEDDDAAEVASDDEDTDSDDTEDEDSDDEEPADDPDEEEEEPVRPKADKKKPAAAPAPAPAKKKAKKEESEEEVEDESDPDLDDPDLLDDDDDADTVDDADDEDEPPAKPAKKTPPPATKKPSAPPPKKKK